MTRAEAELLAALRAERDPSPARWRELKARADAPRHAPTTTRPTTATTEGQAA